MMFLIYISLLTPRLAAEADSPPGTAIGKVDKITFISLVRLSLAMIIGIAARSFAVTEFKIYNACFPPLRKCFHRVITNHNIITHHHHATHLWNSITITLVPDANMGT
jgi:hypothetical protein